MPTIFGTNLNDRLHGTSGNDALYGLDGNDTLIGGYGGDEIHGGDGTDRASYHDSTTGVWVDLASGQGFSGYARGDVLFSIEDVSGSLYYDDLLIGNDGANLLAGYGGHDTLKGGGGADRLYGEEGNDTLYGGSSADILDGGLGIDTLMGGAGDDVYYVFDTDTVSEAAGEGNDVVFSYALGYTLTANVETLSLAPAYSRAVYGTGNAQANIIYGNAGDNVLEGGGGADILNGLGGNDNFVFRPRDANGDVVHEFAGNGTGVGDFMYFIGYGTQADGASFVQLTATTWQINSADGLVHDVITFSGGSAIDPGDFVFV
jgi:Ca2+-binding RTX toxin-like protein